jgi:hypothetical protein
VENKGFDVLEEREREKKKRSRPPPLSHDLPSWRSMKAGVKEQGERRREGVRRRKKLRERGVVE